MQDAQGQDNVGTTAEKLPRLDKTNLWDRSYNLLKQMILRREFKPGAKLALPELSRQLGVSRTPIREALNRLEMDGLVRTVPKVGTFVNAIDEAMIGDVMNTRLMIELWVAQVLPQVPKEVVMDTADKMQAILASTAKLIRARQFSAHAIAENNVEFHLLYIGLGGNRYNIEIYRTAMNYRSIAIQNDLISKEMIESAHSQHEEIVAAIRSQDADRVRSIIQTHIADSQKRLVGNIIRGGGVI
ncbi:MAG TPA: GntR family transcriptional regulator [Spirochaetia bacterium]|nr:GntR family transcriptional regulator [Spirochaetia bacterium]